MFDDLLPLEYGLAIGHTFDVDLVHLLCVVKDLLSMDCFDLVLKLNDLDFQSLNLLLVAFQVIFKLFAPFPLDFKMLFEHQNLRRFLGLLLE
jgi:hypothetical protein